MWRSYRVDFIVGNTIAKLSFIPANVVMWVALAVMVVLFIIFQVIASKLRKARIERQKYVKKDVLVDRQY